jgi:hypothetical protein
VQDADHHMYLDNPTDLIFRILNETYGEQIAEAY